jgi:hypothetical protein
MLVVTNKVVIHKARSDIQDTMTKIENKHLLEDIFGHFPSFHDAEVLRIELNREDIRTLPTFEAQIHIFEATSEVKDGQYVLRHHNIVTFRFLEIDELTVKGFNNQNVLSDLTINDISDQQLEWLNFDVHFDGIFGTDIRFKCGSVKIVSVQPFSN